MSQLHFQVKNALAVYRGAETRGGWGIYPPIIWLYPPHSLRMVHTCTPPPNNLNGCTSERKFGGKSVLFLMKNFFGGSSPEFGEKKCSIFDEDLFFWSSPEFGEKQVFHFW